MWDGIIDLLITGGIVAGIAFLIYTRVKKQDLKDTWDEIKELITETD